MKKTLKELKNNIIRLEKELENLRIKRALAENKNVIIKLDNKINSLTIDLCKIKKAIQILES